MALYLLGDRKELMSDYIERENAVVAIQKRIEQLMNDKEYRKKADAIDLHGAIPIINAIPSADVEPVKRGRWVAYECGCGFYCSKCDEPATIDSEHNYVKTNYCPNCGSKMR